MNPQFNSNYSKINFQNKPTEYQRKNKPRQSEPPLFQQDQEIFIQNITQQKVRKSRPSQIKYDNAINQFPSRGNTNQLTFPQNQRKGLNLTQNQQISYKQDYAFDRIVSQNQSTRDDRQPYSSNKQISNSNNRFLSPQIKITSQNQIMQRKYSQNFQDINFFKGHKPGLSNINKFNQKKDNNNRNEELQNIKIINSSTNKQKRIPRFSQPANFNAQFEQQTTSMIYKKKNQFNQQNKKVNQKLKTQKQFSSIQKKIANNPQNQFGQNTSKFKKNKDPKQNVGNLSTLDSKKIDGKKQMQIKVSDFFRGKQMGNGKFGSVCIVRHKYTGFICAMKTIPKAMIIQENIINQLIRQLKIQTFLDHPNIIKLYGFFHDKLNIYLLLQLGSSGQLYKVIKQKQRIPQLSAAYVIKQVCQAIRYLHFFKIIHRDLKPENIVIQSGIVKLCDFGWAVCRGTQLRSTFCGTPLYVSPQLLKGNLYDQKIDLWAVGILTYELIFGNIPFQINTDSQLIKIIKQDIVFPAHIKISNQAKDFILSILKKNPDQRLKIGELLEHEFMKKSPQMAQQIQ